MMAAIILVVSLVTLMMFFVSYCRSLMASSASHALSEEVRDVTGIRSPASGRDFTKVMQLLQLCPERPADRVDGPVQIYYSFLARRSPRFPEWRLRSARGRKMSALVVPISWPWFSTSESP